jgi:hypothetical protein
MDTFCQCFMTVMKFQVVMFRVALDIRMFE